MTTNTKDWIQYSSAMLMIVSGVVLTFLNFILYGEVSDGVLWYMAQALTYAGGIFGVSIYFRTKLGDSVTDIRKFIDNKFDEITKDKTKDGFRDGYTEGQQESKKE